MRYSQWCLVVLLGCSSLTAVPQTVTLRVKVTDKAGQPIAGAVVIPGGLYDSSDRYPRTGADGWAEVPGLRPGQYHLIISARDYVSPRPQDVILGGDKPVEEFSFQLTRGCQVLGRVRIPPNMPPPSTRGWVRRFAEDAHGGPMQVTLGPDGDFALTLTDFGPAKWGVRAEGYDWVVTELDPQPDGLIEGLEFLINMFFLMRR